MVLLHKNVQILGPFNLSNFTAHFGMPFCIFSGRSKLSPNVGLITFQLIQCSFDQQFDLLPPVRAVCFNATDAIQVSTPRKHQPKAPMEGAMGIADLINNVIYVFSLENPIGNQKANNVDA